MDLISIIVPVYKVEKYIDCCIESIVNQTYNNLEIILVDDGSPDKCPEMCDTWADKDPRITVIHKKNGGLSDARNFGMKVATGKYIAFVDSDDWIEECYIEYLYEAISKTGASLSACEMREVTDNQEELVVEKPILKIREYTSYEAMAELQSGKIFQSVAWNKLYKKELLENEKFEVGKLHEDEFFSYRIIDKAEKLAFTDAVLYNYRQRAGSIMNTFSLGHLDVLDAYLKRLSLLEKNYPQLVIKDKILICMTCVNLYCDVIEKTCTDKKEAKNRIRQCRSKVHFSIEEWRNISMKEKIYVMGSLTPIIKLFYLIRKMRGI